MAKSNKKTNKLVIFDFTEYYNSIKEQEEKDKITAEILRIAKPYEPKKPSLWTRIKNWFKR